MKTAFFSFIILLSSNLTFANTYKHCNTSKWDNHVSTAKAGMKLEKIMGGKTLVLYQEGGTQKDYKDRFPMRISAKKLNENCVEFTVTTNDGAEPGMGGNDHEIKFAGNWIDFNIGDDGRAYYMFLNDGAFDPENSPCEKTKKGDYTGGSIVGTYMSTWSANVDSTGFNACFE